MSNDGTSSRDEQMIIYNLAVGFCQDYKLSQTHAMTFLYDDSNRTFFLDYLEEKGLAVKVHKFTTLDGLGEDKTIGLVFDVEENEALTMLLLKK